MMFPAIVRCTTAQVVLKQSGVSSKLILVRCPRRWGLSGGPGGQRPVRVRRPRCDQRRWARAVPAAV